MQYFFYPGPMINLHIRKSCSTAPGAQSSKTIAIIWEGKGEIGKSKGEIGCVGCSRPALLSSQGQDGVEVAWVAWRGWRGVGAWRPALQHPAAMLAKLLMRVDLRGKFSWSA